MAPSQFEFETPGLDTLLSLYRSVVLKSSPTATLHILNSQHLLHISESPPADFVDDLLIVTNAGGLTTPSNTEGPIHQSQCLNPFTVTEALRIAKADSRSSVLILLDLSAAFETVNHHILLSTLSSLGITGIPLHWFESYLTGRSFRVDWGGGGCLADILAWMKEHCLQLNLAKTELLVFPATPTLHHDFTIQFALHNIRKIRPFLTEQATQLLVQALVISRLDYCNALLAGLPSCIIKPLQMIQNAAARLVFNKPKRAHVTPLFITLHWLMLAYRTATDSAPTYLHSLLRIYTPFRSLRSTSERPLIVPSQRGTEALSRTFSFTVPGWWPNPEC
ncbi:Protein phosphatase 2C 1 [Labeo rohita]|uniref:Protein phosphatase 2C 1 n=1 Tax=Labeo rohita TaxID=84645 RepID=A0ABQ8LHL7_LABRO|nr:Protein phosphatase 2C 1 [Labeo rohita]